MKHDQVFLKHILDEIDFLISETEGKKFEEFIKNEEIQTAFLDCLSEHPRIRNGPDGIAFFEEFFAEEH